MLDINKSRTIFNDTLRTNSPTIYLVDPELIVYSYLDALLDNPSKYIKSVITTEGYIHSNDPDFLNSVNALKFTTLYANIPNIVQLITNSLNTEFKELNIATVHTEILNIYNRMLSKLNIAAASKNRSYISFQRAAANAGADVRRYLNSIKIARLSDTNTVVANLNNRIPFIGFSFENTRSAINKVLDTVLQKSLSKYLVLDKSMYIGNLVHAGHVGLYNEAGDLLGINTPGGTIAGIISNNFNAIEQAIGSIPIHINQGIRLTTDYTSSAGAFLDLQFNFAVSMTETLNSRVLSPLETAAITSIVGIIAEDALGKALETQLSSDSIIKMMPELSASPTIKEFIVNSIILTLQGKSSTSIKHSIKVSNIGNIVTNISASNNVLKSSKIKIPNKTNPTIRKYTVMPAPSTVNLQSLLSANIAEQVRKNMGTGDRQDVLNYRTGRFANSVTIERLTTSRAGMISVYYNYMRNPYGTFSQGGQQEVPRSRDPKTLISKSIREIGASAMYNRMRAVLV